MANKNNEIENARYLKEKLGAQADNISRSEEIQNNTNASKIRQTKYKTKLEIEREYKRGLVRGNGIDPYDNTPGGSNKLPKDKLMSLTNGAYTATLLEKILKASDSSQFQNTTLKFQEQTLNYMQQISTDIKSIAELLKPKEVQEEDSQEELKMEMSNMAKALAGLDIENIAKELGKSVYNKLDSSGYGDIVKSMYDSVKEQIQGGEFSKMVKGMMQNAMLSQLPQEWQQNIQQFRDDPVKLMQLQLNKLGRSDNGVIRDIFSSFVRKEQPNTELQQKKIDMSAKALFDNKVYTSITKVIPEQLYRIVAALEGHEVRMYDWEEQKYLWGSEVYAKAARNNWSASPEAMQNRVMDIFSYAFESLSEKKGKIGINNLFQMNDDGTIAKDVVTGHVKFRNQRMKNLLVDIMKSGIPLSEITHTDASILIKDLGVKWKDESERGRIIDDIVSIQRMLKAMDFEDNKDIMEDLSDFRSSVHNKFRDDRADLLTVEEQKTIDRILYNGNLTEDQKVNLLRRFNQKGVKVWGEGLGGGYGGRNGGSGRGPSGGGGGSVPPVGSASNTDFEGILNEVNNAGPRQYSDKELEKVRNFQEMLASGKRSSYKENNKNAPLTDKDKFHRELNELYSMKAIDKATFNRMSQANSKSNLSASDSDVFKNGGIKVAAAHKLFGILSDAGWTAESKAAYLGISVQEARAQGYVSSAWELMEYLDDNGEVIESKIKNTKMRYLSKSEMEYLEKLGKQRQRSTLGSGSIDKQISRTLTGIFGDPKIANKAGMALGGAAGLGVHKLLKDAGFVSDPRFGWVLGGLGASLMTMERSRNFMNDVFGPAGDIKGANGFTNKEIFAAKFMTKYLPMIGIGGKAAQYVLKASNALGPFGKAFGLVAAPIIGFGVGAASSSIIKFGRDWLFNPERDKNSKIGKLASLLKDIPGVKKLFALSDDRNDEEVMLSGLRQTLSYYQAKDAADKAKGGPGFSREINAINRTIITLEKHIKVIKAEEAKEDSEDDQPNQKKIEEARKAINKALASLDDVLKKTGGHEVRERYTEEQMDARDQQNRMRSAADQNYNKIGEEQRNKVDEIINKYVDASDENKASFREFIAGDTGSVLDNIKDKELRDELDAMVYASVNGEDVSGRYKLWERKFKQKDPQGYMSWLEETSGGSKASNFMNEVLTEIEKYVVEEMHLTDPVEVQQEAQRLLMTRLNSKSMGRMIKENVGDVGKDILARFSGKMNGVDAEERENERNIRDFVTARRYENTEANRNKRQERRNEHRRRNQATQNRTDAMNAQKAANLEDMARSVDISNFDTYEDVRRYWKEHYGMTGRDSRLSNEEIDEFFDMYDEYHSNESSDHGVPTDRRERLERMYEEYKKANRSWTNNDLKRYWNENYRTNDDKQGLSKDELQWLQDRYAGGRGDKPVKMKQMAKLKFASGESLDIAGCSVAAITNALIYMGINAPEPETLIGVANKYLTKDGGVTSGFFREVCKSLGIDVDIFNNQENVFTADVFRSFMVGKDSGLVCLLKNQLNSGYHYVTIKSVSGHKVTIDDPEVAGLTQTTTSEIASRAVEIIHMTAGSQHELRADVNDEMQDAAYKAHSRSAARAPQSLKQAVIGAVSDVASTTVGKLASGAAKVGGKWAGLLEALKHAVFNVRLVDDYTLPLKMGDPEAALAVSRMQLAAAGASGITAHAQRIKKMMQNKDVQNEMKEADLVQDAILNGGLVAGSGTGAGGRGTTGTTSGGGAAGLYNNLVGGNSSGGDGNGGNNGTDGKPGGTLWDTIKQGAAGFAGGLAAKAGNMLTLGALAVPALAQGAASFVSRKFFGWGKQRLDEAKNNMFGEITDEDREQKFDENGNQTQRGVWRDVSGAMRSVKDGLSFVKAGLGVHGLVSKGIKKAGNFLIEKTGKNFLKNAGKAMTGSGGKGVIRTIINLLNKALIEIPEWLTKKLFTPKVANIIGGTGIVQGVIGDALSTITGACSKLAKKIVKPLSSKLAAGLGKNVAGGWLKKMINKIPGGILVTAAIQLPFAAIDGYRHAAQYLDRKPEEVSFGDKIKVMLAKAFYDCVPDIIMGFMTIGMPVLSVLGDIFVAVVRGMYTFEDCMVDFGLKEKAWKGDEIEKAEKEQETQAEKEANIKELKEQGKITDKYEKNVKDIQSGEFTLRHEQFRSKWYYDKYNNKTIGYGINLDSGRWSKEQVDRWMREGISQEEAMSIFKEERARARNQLETKYTWFKTLDPVRQEALVDMVYNMGIGSKKTGDGFDSFQKMIAALERGDYETAAKESLDSKYSGDVGGRAKEIADLIRYGDGSTAPMAPTSGTSSDTVEHSMTELVNNVMGGQTSPGIPKPISAGWGSPVKGNLVVTSAFGHRTLDDNDASKDHKGIDIRGTKSDPILAAKEGKVIQAGGGGSNSIIIEHPDGTITKYLHASKVMVRHGEHVKQGQVIGMIGGFGEGRQDRWGPHLHFETLIKGKNVDPFVELGLNYSHLKLPNQNGGGKKDTVENVAYITRHADWFKDVAKQRSDNMLLAANAENTVSKNKEAAGPSINERTSNYGNTTIVNRDIQLEKYVQTLDAKFSQMIELLNKLVNISQENTNNVLSDAIAPARI